MDREQNEERMVEAQLEVLRFLSDSTDDYLFLLEFRQGRLYFPGQIWEKYPLHKRGEDWCTVEDWVQIVYERDRPALVADLEELCKRSKPEHDMEYRLVDREGKLVWVNCRGRCQMDSKGQPICMIGRVSDMVLEQKVDPLTGAFNGSELSEEIDAVRTSGKPGYLLLLGVDNLKHINLRHGRNRGNSILHAVMDTLERQVAPGLRIYRLNGDCFAVNLPAEDESEVQQVYDQVKDCLARNDCTISGGAVAYHRYGGEDAGTIYQYAEEALDRAKRMGKNNLAFFSWRDYEEKLSTIELQEEFKQSIQNGFQGFSLRYQPQVRSCSYDIYGAEVLLRYDSPTRGSISPADFVPLLEQTGMICQVGMWVLETAMAQCLQWRKTVPNFHISVNLSYVQLAQQGITQQILDALNRAGLPGDALTLEVTENMQLQDYPHFNRIFYQWKRAGIQISVDDFGTGYSSLSYLKSLEIDEIKIDRCFVSGIQHSAYNYRLLSNMVELARDSQMQICCEGVETEEELAVLEELHPDLLQGFFFHRPCTPEEFDELYIRTNTPERQAQMAHREQMCQLKWGKHPMPGDMSPTTESLETILESMDEIIYVSDLANHELYYLNPVGCGLTGVYDYKGQKCYKVLQGRNSPCEFCTNDRLTKDSFYIWEWDNQLLHRHYILKDKLIDWRGKTCRLELAIDVSEREVLSKSVREKLDFAENVLACAKTLVEEPDMEQATRHMLALLGDFYQADRAYLFEPVPHSTELWNNTYEWCQSGVTAQRANLQNVPSVLLRRWLNLFEQDQSVVVLNLDDYRESDPEEWESLARQGIRRMIAAPIRRQGRLYGFLGVDNPRHCIEDDAMLRMLTMFVANRFRRNEAEDRLGELLDLHYQDVLKETRLGLWFIRVDPNSGRRELFADKTMRQVLGMEKELPPEECYRYWYDRINGGYYNYVSSAVERMIQTGQVVQLEYSWTHPTQGGVMVCCIGIRTKDSDGMICLEGYHRIISGMEQTKVVQDTDAGEVFEFNERKGTIYFHTGRTLLAGESVHEEHFPQCWLDRKMVHPHFAKRFRELLQNVQQSADLDGEELLLQSKQGTYTWFKMDIRHMGSGVQDRDTILVRLSAADHERLMELENIRIRDFYRASLSEAIAYAELDLESEQLNAAGGLWASYAEQCRHLDSGSVLQFMMGQVSGQVRLEDQNLSSTTGSSWKSLLADEGGQTYRFRYQRLLHGQWRWVELVAHTFREEFTENAYALLYLKDKDTQIRRELAQRDAARRDPLTQVYNRNAFRNEVEQYITVPDDGHSGVLMLLDIDNFKSINDRFGHMEGDKVLKYLTNLLQKTFRSGDLVGRLGGDEFMVFLKGYVCRATLEERLKILAEALRQYELLPITCSIGITHVSSRGFSYDESLRQADTALYRSKKENKGGYSYAEEPEKTDGV